MKGKVYYVNTGCYIHGTVRYPREAQIRTHRPTASTYLRTVWSRFSSLFREIRDEKYNPAH